jgi:hypothetical protein
MIAEALNFPSFGAIEWILSLVTLANLALALVVLRHAPRREENRVFAITCASIALWTLTNALFRVTTSHAAIVLWAQLSYAAALILAASFLHFSGVYPIRRPLHWPVLRLLSWLIALMLSVLCFVPGAVLTGVDLAERRILTTSGLYLLAVYFFATLGLACWRFWRHQRRLHGVAREQARYVLLGAVLTIGFGLFFNLLLPLWGNYRWVWAGPASSLFFVGFTVYSIVAHHLFDIRVLIRRTVVYSLLLALLAVGFSALEMLVSAAVGLLLGAGNQSLAHLVTALVISLGVQPLRKSLEQWAQKRLFPKTCEESGQGNCGDSGGDSGGNSGSKARKVGPHSIR